MRRLSNNSALRVRGQVPSVHSFGLMYLTLVILDGYIKIADTYICDTAESAAHAFPHSPHSGHHA